MSDGFGAFRISLAVSGSGVSTWSTASTAPCRVLIFFGGGFWIQSIVALTSSLLKSMALDTVTLDDALKLLSLPRTLGELDGEQVTVQNGRYGPYVKKGTDSRSLESEEQLFTLTLAEAKELFAQPKTRGRRTGAAAPPLRELGQDPATGKPMVIKDGRFGPYVTDGETNASLRKGDEVATITVQRGAELLADRRAAPPTTRRRTTTTRKKAATPARSGSKKN